MIKIDNNYLMKLFHQFHEADGIRSLEKIDSSFLNWLQEYQKVLLLFKDYYNSLGLSIDDLNAFEIGKGCLDSIIIDKTRMISFYGEKKSELYIMDNIPLVISDEGVKKIDGSDLIYTYNPYTIYDYQVMKNLALTGEQFSISVCGKIFDKDKELKIDKLMDIFSDFTGMHNYEENCDNYFYTIYTPKKIKQRILTR